MELAGYRQVAATTRPGEVIVTLCWRAHAPMSENYTVLLEALAPDGQTLGARATFPGNGNYATTQWRVGELFCEPYPVSAFAAGRPVLPSALQVSVLTEPDHERLLPYTTGGTVYAQPVHIPVP